MPEQTPPKTSRRPLILLASAGGALATALAIASLRATAGAPALLPSTPAPSPAAAPLQDPDPPDAAAPSTPSPEPLPDAAAPSAAATPSPDSLPDDAAASASPSPTAPALSDPPDMSSPTGTSGHVPPTPSRSPRPPFDEAAARAVLDRRAADVRACKAGSSFRSVATTVRLTGDVTVSPRGRASVALPPGYDVNPCLERLVAGLRFRPSLDGGAFTYTFQL